MAGFEVITYGRIEVITEGLVICWAQSGVGEPTSICIATLTTRRSPASSGRSM
jgi:hypothetical protein